MSLYKLISFIPVIFVSVASADEAPANTKTNTVNSRYLNLTAQYVSWSEALALKSGSLQDNASATFSGLGIQLEREQYKGESGRRWGASIDVGQASAGSINQANVPYIAASQSFWGISSYYYFSYRKTAQTSLSLGPFLLYRNIQWPQAAGVSSVSSGQPVNAGLALDLKFRLNRLIEFETNIGALAMNASTYWSFGIGYKL